MGRPLQPPTIKPLYRKDGTVRGYCQQLRTEFSGHQSGTVTELLAGTATN